MKTLILALSLIVLSGCTTLAPSIISKHSSSEPTEQLIWSGTGTSWIHQEGNWVRTPAQDYQFLVRQNRFPERWESLKIQNRTHSDYNGAAGNPDQQHSFLIEYQEPGEDGRRGTSVESSYGSGHGWTDEEYRHAILEFEAVGVSRFAPYNRFRITQEYLYEEGRLVETVELFKLEKDGTESPFVKIEEEAFMFHRKPETVSHNL